MKFKDYVQVLNDFLADNPESGEYDVLYSKDDEGSGYQQIDIEEPVIGMHDGEYYAEFETQKGYDSDMEEAITEGEYNKEEFQEEFGIFKANGILIN